MHWKWFFWRWGGFPGEPIQIQKALFDDLAEQVGMSCPVYGVVYVGTPGAYRKAVIGLWNRQDNCRIVKLSLSALADQTIEDETVSLHRLEGSMQGSIPKILAEGVWYERPFIGISPFSGVRGKRILSAEHFAWCRRLFLADQKKFTWEQSPFRLNLHTKYSILQRHHHLATPLAHVFKKADQFLHGRVFPFGWAHRDFTPWNTRMDGDQLLVFDWEMARPDYPPGYDLFHFVSIQAGLRIALARESKKTLLPWLESLAPEWTDFARELYLLYLLDQAVFYMEARVHAPEAGNEIFLDWLGNQILSIGSSLE